MWSRATRNIQAAKERTGNAMEEALRSEAPTIDLQDTAETLNVEGPSLEEEQVEELRSKSSTEDLQYTMKTLNAEKPGLEEHDVENLRSESPTEDLQHAVKTLNVGEPSQKDQEEVSAADESDTSDKIKNIESDLDLNSKTKNQIFEAPRGRQTGQDLIVTSTHFEPLVNQTMFDKIWRKFPKDEDWKMKDQPVGDSQIEYKHSDENMHNPLPQVEGLQTSLALAVSGERDRATIEPQDAWDHHARLELQLEKDYDALAKGKRELEATLREVRATLEERDRKLLRFTGDLAMAKSDNDDKSATIKETEGKLDRAKERIKEVEDDVDRLNAIVEGFREAPSQRLHDEYFQLAFSDLRSKVEIWAEDHFVGKLQQSFGGNFDMRLRGSFDGKSFEQYLRSDFQRDKMIQFITWSLLIERVFDGSSEHTSALWAAPHHRHVTNFLRDLSPTGMTQ
jgi:hypothetical protein